MTLRLIFADSESNNKRRKTPKEIFLARMNELMPLDRLEAKIEPFYSKLSRADDLTLFQPCSAFIAFRSTP